MALCDVTLRTVVGREARPTTGHFLSTILIEVTPPKDAERLPLNLHLLIDASASMAGEKLEAVKEACGRIVSDLHPEDIASIAIFSTEANLLVGARPMTEGAKEAARKELEGLRAGGVTRLEAGLDLAFAETSQFHSPDRRMSVIILLSDGFPTTAGGERITEFSPFLRQVENYGNQGISFSTVGLGNAARYDKDFLIALAERGNGAFQYAATAEELVPLILEEFQKFQQTVIPSFELVIEEIAGEIRRFCRVSPEIKIFDPPIVEGEKTTLSCGSLQQGVSQLYLLDIITPPQPGTGKRRLCDISVASAGTMGPSACVTIEYTDEESRLSQPMRREVESWIDLLQVFVTQGKIEASLKAGDLKKTRVLLNNARGITRRLGESGKTRLLDDIAERLQRGEPISEDELTRAKLASKKTKVLT